MRAGNFGSLDFRPFTRLGAQGTDAPPVVSAFILQRDFTGTGGTLPPEVTFTRAGIAWDPWTLQQYGANEPRLYDGRGLLMEPAATNRVTIHNAKPTDTTGLTLSGDPFASLSLFDDTTNLTGSGFDMTVLNGNVFRLDNLLGGEPAYVDVAGQAGGTADHSVSAYVRAEGSRTGLLRLSGQGGSSHILQTGWTLESERYSGVQATDTFRIQADPGCVVYFIVPQLEEDYTTSTIVTEGATASRVGEECTEPLSRTGPCTWGVEVECDFTRFGGTPDQPRLMTLYDTAALANSLEIYSDPAQPGKLRYRVRTGSTTRADTTGTVDSAQPPDVTYADGISQDANYRWYNGGILDVTQTPAGVNVPDTTTVAYGFLPSTGGQQLSGYVRRAYVATAEITPTPPEPPEPPPSYPGGTDQRFRLAGDGRIDLPVSLDGGITTRLTYKVGLTTHGADRAMLGDANAIVHHVWLSASQHGAGWGVLTEDKVDPPDAIQTTVEHDVEIKWTAGGETTVTVDGVNPQTFPLQAIMTDGSFTIGDHTGTPGGAGIAPWSGYIYDVRLYDNGDQSTLTHHWPLDEGSGTTAHDAVDPNYNGTIVPGSGAWDLTSYPAPSRHLVFAGDTYISCPVTIDAGQAFKIEATIEITGTGTKRVWTAGDSFDEISGPGAAIVGTGTVTGS